MSLTPKAKRDIAYGALLIVWEIIVAVVSANYLIDAPSSSDLLVWMSRLMNSLLIYCAGSIVIMILWYGPKNVLGIRPILVWHGLSFLGAFPAGFALGWYLDNFL